jgi:hypothetical protein
MGFATSLFGMIINSGAATGIAIVTNSLTSRHRFHQAQLNSYLTLVHAAHRSGVPLTAVGGPLLPQSNIDSQAWLLAYHDIYRVLAFLIVLLAPWCLLLKPAAGTEATEKAIFE